MRSVLVTSARSARGQDHDRLEPRLGRGVGGPVGRARRGRPAPAEPGRALRARTPRPGLAEVLQGEVAVADALQAVATVRRGRRERLSAPAGRARRGPAAGQPVGADAVDVHGARAGRARAAITTSSSSTRRRSPHVADAISLLRHVDGVLIAAAVNSTRGPDASRLRDQLQALDANILGVVANGGSALQRLRLRRTPRDAESPSAGGERRRRSRPATPVRRREHGRAQRPLSKRLLAELGAAPAQDVGNRPEQDLRVEPERPVRAVQVVDRDHVAHRARGSSRGSARGR